jgi:hypothetical protein
MAMDTPPLLGTVVDATSAASVMLVGELHVAEAPKLCTEITIAFDTVVVIEGAAWLDALAVAEPALMLMGDEVLILKKLLMTPAAGYDVLKLQVKLSGSFIEAVFQ